MPSLRTTIVDADGRRVPLAPHEIRSAFADDERAVRLRAASARRAKPTTPREWLRGAAWGAAALPVLLAASVLPMAIAMRFRTPWWVTLCAALPMALVPVIVTVFLARRVAAERIARVHLIAGYCPSCAQDFGPHPWSNGPRHRCAECGAAWCAPIDECRQDR